MTSNWYQDSLFILHFDRNYSTGNYPATFSGFDPGQVRQVLQHVRPDVVQYAAKGQSGLTAYPTQFGQSAPDVYHSDFNILRAYRDITRVLDIRFVVSCSGLIDHTAADWYPGWLRVKADLQPYPSRALCPNAGYVEEMLLPQLEEIIEQFEPDGIWIDAESWTVAPCYCSSCNTEFQMMHERDAPEDRRDPLWPKWLQFHRDAYLRYLGRVARYVQDHGPDMIYASNGSFCTHQPEPIPLGPNRLTWDLSPAFSLRQAGMEARFLDQRGLPFDLMTWNRASARPWPLGKLPALPVYPKAFDQLVQEGAVILANGGRWGIGMTPYADDALPEMESEVVAAAAEFARERRDITLGAESAAYVAIIHSDETHRRSGNGLYDPGPSLDRIRGVHQALLELHHPHDIVTPEVFLAQRDRYRVAILPEQIDLPQTLDEPLAQWVREGGKLIASGRVSPRIMEDIPTFACEEVFGIRWTGRRDREGYFLHRGFPLRVAAPVYHTALHEAELLQPLVVSDHELRRQETGMVAVSRHQYGAGEGYYLAADFFAAYHRCQFYAFRDLLGDVLELALPVPPLITTAPPSIEMVWRKKGERQIVHFVNHAPDKSLAQNNAFIEQVPMTQPFSITLALSEEPSGVRLQPGNGEVEWSYAEGTLTAFIPPFHVHTALVISPHRDGV